MNYYDKESIESEEELINLLKLPVEKDVHLESFDPWRLFENSLYGSYSSEFDEMAIQTLEDILNSTTIAKKYGLAEEMFREILCNKGLCDYGTSPRYCWANGGFKKLIPEYLEKWRQYYKYQWED